MRDYFLFVRPPRPLWPFIGPASAFWPPLAFASLAGALRQHLPDLRVGILDAPIQKMGWQTLESTIRRERPTYIGIGEEAVGCADTLRLAALAKDLGSRVVAGGCFFGHVAPQVLATGLVDVVVHGEGEETIVELVRALRSNNLSALQDVRGISFQENEGVHFTGVRPPMADLDRLPFPAYDLLPTSRYGAGSRSHPDFAAIELSRGCSCACEFCVLWRHMGRQRDADVTPYLRTKSSERLLDEIRILTQKYQRRYLAWVDPCFNAHPSVPGELAQQLLRENLRLGQSAWMRADYIVRDAVSGALDSSVRSGLNEVFLGIERSEEEELRALGKGSGLAAAHEASQRLLRDYPEVVTVGSFIYGLPGDSPDTIRAIYRLACDLELDLVFYIPVTPLPGTPYWRPELWDPTGEAFRAFDFLPQVKGDADQARLATTLMWCFFSICPPSRRRWFWRAISSRSPRRRRIMQRHLLRGTYFGAVGILQSLLSGRKPGGMVYPSWYDD